MSRLRCPNCEAVAEVPEGAVRIRCEACGATGTIPEHLRTDEETTAPDAASGGREEASASCPSCGAEASAGSSFCPRCGTAFSADPDRTSRSPPDRGSAGAGSPGRTSAAPTQAGGQGPGHGGATARTRQGGQAGLGPAAGGSRPGSSPPAGKQRNPMVTAVLGVITLGVYVWAWLWMVTGEARRFDESRKTGHGPIKWGLPALVLGGLAVWAGVSSLSPDMIALGAVVGFVGILGVLTAQWRLWGFVSHHERSLDVSHPISPTAMLLALIAGGFLGRIAGAAAPETPLGMIVPTAVNLYVVYRTQKGLNRIWNAAASGYRPGGRQIPEPGQAAHVPGAGVPADADVRS